ncbi:MAG: RodZ domain-containing protein [Bacteroidota bacterium]
MNEFADELRASREAKHISLTDISSATKIQLKYLQAMEEGDFTFLPEPYIRAFLRDYANAVQLDPEATIAKYEASMKAPEASAERPQPEPKESTRVFLVEHDIPKRTPEIPRPHGLPFRDVLSNQTSKRKWLPVVAFILLIVVVVLVASITGNGRKEPVSETPFEQIVKEKERSPSDQPAGASATAVPSAISRPYNDSLVLEGRTSLDVWVRLVIDDDSTKEYLFGPKMVRTWKAKVKFRVSLGNAGGMTFRLNGKELGMLGKPGAIVRNALITRNGVQR